MENKVCKTCNIEKELSEFPQGKRYKNGRRPICYGCFYIQQKDCIKKYRSGEKFKKKRKSYYDNYMKDELYRIKCSIRSRLHLILKNKGMIKSASTEKILGCSFEFLISFLETKFVDGMSWENYGDWHVDHIIPLSSSITEEDLYKLSHYSNLQPLWAKDNLKKSNKSPTSM